MRYLQPIPGLLTMTAILVACSTSGASPSAQTSQAAGASQSATPSASQSAAPSQPAASTGAGANGSVTYHISGDYTASGELPLVVLASSSFDPAVFDTTGWVATFAQTNGTVVLRLDTRPAGSSHPNSPSAEFSDGVAIVTATEAFGCTFTFTKNDAGGLAGKVECPATHVSNAGAVGTVDFSAAWDARPPTGVR
jgi:hypothetical protein